MGIYRVIYKEQTNDRGYVTAACCSDTNSEYWLRSSSMKDALSAYLKRYERWPSSRWYRRHARWSKEREY